MKKFTYICKIFTWSLKHLFYAARFESFILVLFVVFQGMIPAISLYAIQGIIQWISLTSTFPVFFVSLFGGMLLADVCLSPLVSVARLHLNEKMLAYCNLLLMEKANQIQGLAPFENSKFYDEIQFLKNESSKRPLNFVYVLTGFIKEGVALLTVLSVLISLGWWIPLGILLASLPHAISNLWFEKQSWDQMLFTSPDTRKLAWISSLTVDDRFAKEVRLFGFGSFLVERYKQLAKTMHQSVFKRRWKKSAFSIFLSSLSIVGNITIISMVLMRAKEGNLQISGLVIAIQALIMTQNQLIGFIAYAGMAAPIILFFDKLKTFVDQPIDLISEKNKRGIDANFSHERPSCRNPIPLDAGQGGNEISDQPYPSRISSPWRGFSQIRFENVSFSYADGRKVLSNVNFMIRAGEKVAIVGQNGAGKSTIVKLLLRFYDPSEGVITVDGKDLKKIDLTSWRSEISGVFQDFGQYHFTVSENISLGDVKAPKNRITNAAKQGGFDTVLPRLPEGLNELLGKEFGGTSLSGGEWQKLAMSRAFIRDASLLILDEPTSALDPQSEQEIFNKFSEVSQERTSLLITHRLGSVKMANRILVFNNGLLIEEGTHSQLLMKKGNYAHIFNLQAKQYI